MKKSLTFSSIIILGIMSFALSTKADGFKEGEWSMTMTVRADGGMGQEMAQAQKEMENMSAEDQAMMQQMMGNLGLQAGGANGGGMTISRRQCLTNENPVPKQEDQENCQETHSMTGSTVKFEVICKDSRSTGEVTYNNDTMQGQIQSNQIRTGREERVQIDLEGKYLGPCTL